MKKRYTAPITWHQNPKREYVEQIADRAVEIIRSGREVSKGSDWAVDLENDPKKLYTELLNGARNALREMAIPLRSDPVIIYRAIVVREDAIRWNDLGIYWAYTESFAEAYWEPVAKLKFDHDLHRWVEYDVPPTQPTLVLQATVANKDVNWLTSLALHMLHAEGELRLRKGAPIQVNAIKFIELPGWLERLCRRSVSIKAYA